MIGKFVDITCVDVHHSQNTVTIIYQTSPTSTYIVSKTIELDLSRRILSYEQERRQFVNNGQEMLLNRVIAQPKQKVITVYYTSGDNLEAIIIDLKLGTIRLGGFERA